MPRVQVTYPLDTLRLRIAVDPSMRGIRGASTALFREGSYSAFFRGLTASLIGNLPHSLLLCCVCMNCVDWPSYSVQTTNIVIKPPPLPPSFPETTTSQKAFLFICFTG